MSCLWTNDISLFWAHGCQVLLVETNTSREANVKVYRTRGSRQISLISALSPDPEHGFDMHIHDGSQLLRKLRTFLCLERRREPEIESFSRRPRSSGCVLNHSSRMETPSSYG